MMLEKVGGRVDRLGDQDAVGEDRGDDMQGDPGLEASAGELKLAGDNQGDP